MWSKTKSRLFPCDLGLVFSEMSGYRMRYPVVDVADLWLLVWWTANLDLGGSVTSSVAQVTCFRRHESF